MEVQRSTGVHVHMCAACVFMCACMCVCVCVCVLTGVDGGLSSSHRHVGGDGHQCCSLHVALLHPSNVHLQLCAAYKHVHVK